MLGLIRVHEIARVARQEDHAAGGREAVDLLGEGDAVELAHADVQHGDVRTVAVLGEHMQHGGRILKRFELMRRVPQRRAQDIHGLPQADGLIITHCKLKHRFDSLSGFAEKVMEDTVIVYQKQECCKQVAKNDRAAPKLDIGARKG